jgi:2-keto-4-pentenoate hydratase
VREVSLGWDGAMLNISEALKKRCDTHPATRMNNIHFRGLSMIELSAAALAEAHRSGVRLRSLPVEPRSTAECFDIQDQVANLLGTTVAGWKAGVPEKTGPYRAPVYSSKIFSSPAQVARAGRSSFEFEAEIVFRFGRALPQRDTPYTTEEVTAAIASAHAAIELVESRYSEAVPYLSRLADNQTHGGLVVGSPVVNWTSLDLANLRVSVYIDDREVSRAVGGNPSIDPLRPVLWLVNHLAAQNGGIAEGAYVTTGSTTGLETAPAGAVARVEFEGLGKAVVQLAD